ncbi:MAG: 4Fe-4S binding protein [Actinomycetaceae bacterium]|nr:4Fe-4S binding protein [Actinomycetaceae bacterium]MDY5854355.1 4Fe-4S binding protein [Arcanobacterium sp.]
MGCGSCIGCDNCYGLCPDNAIAKISTGHYAVKTDYCKGCGICVQECPSGAMAIAAVHR